MWLPIAALAPGNTIGATTALFTLSPRAAGSCGRSSGGGGGSYRGLGGLILAQGVLAFAGASRLAFWRSHGSSGSSRRRRVHVAAAAVPSRANWAAKATAASSSSPQDLHSRQVSTPVHAVETSPAVKGAVEPHGLTRPGILGGGAPWERRAWVPPFHRPTAPPSPPQSQPLAPLQEHMNVPVSRPSVNHGFMFLKPDANIESVRQFVRQRLEERGVRIVAQGSIAAEEILEKRIIDEHYGSLAAKALDQSPVDHVVQPDGQARFKETFGLSWHEALARGIACNARDAMQRLGLSAAELDEKWTPLQIGNGKAKLGGGFYAGYIDGLYVINGFYMAMRSMYTEPGRSVTWFSVEWSSSDLPWEEFRIDLLGDTDPAAARACSLRGGVHRRWRELGLRSEPKVGDNVVHASASPFEAMLERANWTGTPFLADPFGRELLDRGVSERVLKHWATDPIVNHGDQRSSLFDLFENLNSNECVEIAQAVSRGAEETRLPAL